MRSSPLATALAAAALACAGAPAKPVPIPMPTTAEGGASGEVFFVPTGSIGTSAAFDDRRVVGPTVNMAATPEGVWGGDLRGRNLVLEVSEGRLKGAAFEVSVEREGDALRVAGLIGNRRVNVQLSPKRFQGTIDVSGCSFDLPLTAPGSYHGFISCPATPGQRMPDVISASLKLSGDAARVDQPALPQMALAVLAVLPL